MNSDLLFDFIVDKENNTIHMTREFQADIQLVWAAWTTATLLDQWWGPKHHGAPKPNQWTSGKEDTGCTLWWGLKEKTTGVNAHTSLLKKRNPFRKKTIFATKTL